MDADRRLGFPLLRLLQRMYTEVANGSLGPEYGATALSAAPASTSTKGSWTGYRTMRDAGPDKKDVAWPGWPDRLVAVCHWGCAIWSCVDCSTPVGRVIRFDPNEFGPGSESWAGAWTIERLTLADFLRDWLRLAPVHVTRALPDMRHAGAFTPSWELPDDAPRVQ